MEDSVEAHDFADMIRIEYNILTIKTPDDELEFADMVRGWTSLSLGSCPAGSTEDEFTTKTARLLLLSMMNWAGLGAMLTRILVPSDGWKAWEPEENLATRYPWVHDREIKHRYWAG
ncbi:hypothetical protein FALBO_8313 [Fusarium albosuccineum]|uniref:Uncharacterized protein n=1 Tax=Fusarium albosuccineum TaxID=1237068 RepID=A0A8H4P721_9HYPO|nr:hypothetical protein FALBO_8313 [Fusarium albosuccineum]